MLSRCLLRTGTASSPVWSTSTRSLSTTSAVANVEDYSIPTAMKAATSSQSVSIGRVSFSNKLEFRDGYDKFPVYHVMDRDGGIIPDGERPDVDNDTILKMYRVMTELRIMDQLLFSVQRTGQVSFYMVAEGEEAIHVGSAAALDNEDVIYAQYREAGVLLWRGYTIDEMMHQNYGTELDKGKGRQMPIHYGSAELNFQTISSPLATQIPQASGAAYALKMEGKDNIVMCYFGDGAASEGDFHAAVNFAATREAPCVFFCRNNGFAISTPTIEQYRGDGIAARGPAYGIPTVRCDGNDAFAVYNATKAARDLALNENTPVLIEAMTYRGGSHSSSDEKFTYMSEVEDKAYRAMFTDPITRLRTYIESEGIWDEEQQAALEKKAKKAVRDAVRNAGTFKRPPISDLFTDVYDELPWHLNEQYEQLKAFMARHKDDKEMKELIDLFKPEK